MTLIEPRALGSSPLHTTPSDAGGNPLFAATPRRATDPADELGTLDCYTRRCDVVGMVAIDYRDELRAAVDLMPAGTARFHLEGLLLGIDRALEAKAAFDAARQEVTR